MNLSKTYVYLEHIPKDDEFDAEINLVSCINDNCLFSYELKQNGVSDYWNEELEKHPSGFYELEYEWDTESENDDCGYVAYTYAVVVGIVKLTPSTKALLLFIKNKHLIPILNSLLDLFRKVWAVDFEYGGVGITTSNLNILQALWLRYVGHRLKEPSYGPGYKSVLRKR